MKRSIAPTLAFSQLAAVALLLVCSLVALSPTRAEAALACIAPNSGGTAITPPLGCPFVTDPLAPFVIVPTGVLPGTTIEIDVEIIPLALTSHGPGGLLGGDLNDSIAEMHLHLEGTLSLLGFVRDIIMPLPSLETHYGARTPGNAVQTFPSDIFRLDAQLFGDPDFNFLFIRAGTSFGLPSPGSTTLTRLGLPGSDFNVESFFDVFYEIEYQGAPGGQLDTTDSTTLGNAIVRQGVPAPEPSALLLIGTALTSVLALRRARRGRS